MKVFVTGSHSTGKTTLARWISNRFDMPLVSEAVRPVLASREVDINVLRADLNQTEGFQHELIERQVKAEKRKEDAVYDRCTFDYIAYTAEHTCVSYGLKTEMADAAARLKGAVVFLLRPQPELMADDGVREKVVWESVIRIDAMIKLLFEMYDVNYIPISTANMAERARTVATVLQRRL